MRLPRFFRDPASFDVVPPPDTIGVSTPPRRRCVGNRVLPTGVIQPFSCWRPSSYRRQDRVIWHLLEQHRSPDVHCRLSKTLVTEMAPEGRKLSVGETRVFVASEPLERVHCVIRQFGRQPHSTARLLCRPATLHTWSWATRKRENVTFAKRDGKWRCTGSNCLPAPADPLPEPALHHFSAGGAPTLRKPRPRLPCPLPEPLPCFPSFPTSSSYVICHRRGCVSFSGALHHFQSSRARLDIWARRPGARISSVSASVKHFAFT